MSPEDWADRLIAYRRQGRDDDEIAGIAAYLQQRGRRRPRNREDGLARAATLDIVTRPLFQPKGDEDRYLTRDANGRPTLRLVDAGDRLAIWSSLDGGVLINPKGAGLRRLGLYASYAKGARHNRIAYRAADLSKGRWLDLVRELDNPHDANAVAMCAPGSDVRIAHVSKGRAPAVAKRMDAGEAMAGVSIRGPGAGSDDESALILIGSRADLWALLDV